MAGQQENKETGKRVDLTRRRLLLAAAGVSGLSASALAIHRTRRPETVAQVWGFETDGSVTSSPTVVDDTVYIGSNDGNLYSMDAPTGERYAVFETKDGVKSSPTVIDDTVFVGSADGNLYAGAAGQKEWEWSLITRT